MIELSFMQYLENQGFGTIDEDLFLEDVPIGKDGIAKDGLWIITRGSSVDRFDTETRRIDVYSRYKNKITGSQKLQDILDHFRDEYSNICDLPAVLPYTENGYHNVSVTPLGAVESVGIDDNGKIVRLINLEVKFEKGD